MSFDFKAYNKKQHFTDVQNICLMVGIVLLAIGALVMVLQDGVSPLAFFFFLLAVACVSISEVIRRSNVRQRIGTVQPEDMFTLSIVDNCIYIFGDRIPLSSITELIITVKTKISEERMIGNNDVFIRTDENKLLHLGVILEGAEQVMKMEKAVAMLKEKRVIVNYSRSVSINF